METTFLSVLSIDLLRDFFCKWKLLLQLGDSPLLTMNHIPASGHEPFQFFQRFFKVEKAFPYSRKVFFNILHRASGDGLSA